MMKIGDNVRFSDGDVEPYARTLSGKYVTEDETHVLLAGVMDNYTTNKLFLQKQAPIMCSWVDKKLIRGER